MVAGLKAIALAAMAGAIIGCPSIARAASAGDCPGSPLQIYDNINEIVPPGGSPTPGTVVSIAKVRERASRQLVAWLYLDDFGFTQVALLPAADARTKAWFAAHGSGSAALGIAHFVNSYPALPGWLVAVPCHEEQ